MNFLNIYKHHCRFQKTGSDEKKSTVMLVITVGLFKKSAVIYKKLKKIMPALGFELGSQGYRVQTLNQKNFKLFRQRNTYA